MSWGKSYCLLRNRQPLAHVNDRWGEVLRGLTHDKISARHIRNPKEWSCWNGTSKQPHWTLPTVSKAKDGAQASAWHLETSNNQVASLRRRKVVVARQRTGEGEGTEKVGRRTSASVRLRNAMRFVPRGAKERPRRKKRKRRKRSGEKICAGREVGQSFVRTVAVRAGRLAFSFKVGLGHLGLWNWKKERTQHFVVTRLLSLL